MIPIFPTLKMTVSPECFTERSLHLPMLNAEGHGQRTAKVKCLNDKRARHSFLSYPSLSAPQAGMRLNVDGDQPMT
jgi:hypothetical protein